MYCMEVWNPNIPTRTSEFGRAHHSIYPTKKCSVSYYVVYMYIFCNIYILSAVYNYFSLLGRLCGDGSPRVEHFHDVVKHEILSFFVQSSDLGRGLAELVE